MKSCLRFLEEIATRKIKSTRSWISGWRCTCCVQYKQLFNWSLSLSLSRCMAWLAKAIEPRKKGKNPWWWAMYSDDGDYDDDDVKQRHRG